MTHYERPNVTSDQEIQEEIAWRADQMQEQDDALRRHIVELITNTLSSWRLFILALGAFLLLFVVMFIVVQPTYTAVAIVGPPNPSPTNSLIAGISGTSGITSSAARRLLGGGGASTGGNDPFQEYLQLLYSTRLAKELIEKDHILTIIFNEKWDEKNNRWKEPGTLHAITTPIKRLMHRPVSDHPDLYELELFLEKKMFVSQTKSFAASFLSSSGFMTVTLDYPDKEKSELILSIILHRADELIRQEQMRDVVARISYIQSELPTITQAEQRTALIQTLSNQEQLKTMMVADQRFATVLVEPPAASPKPTKPMAPSKAVIVSALLALVTVMLLVLLERKVPLAENILNRFRRRR